MLVDLFSRIGGFFKRLELYTEVPPTSAMTGISVKIMVEVLKILGLATKEIKQRQSSKSIGIYQSYLDLLLAEKFLRKLLGKNEIEDALKRLDAFTQEEARIVTAEVLKVTHRVDDKMTVLIDGA